MDKAVEKYGDCERCVGEQELHFCDECLVWLCKRCLELHSHEAVQDRQRRTNLFLYYGIGRQDA